VDSSNEDFTLIIGRAPVSKLHDYTKDVIGYTRGNGRLSCTSDGYEPCHNVEEIISAVGYDPEADLQNPPHSVFCANGAGFVVPWNEVDDYKHLNIEFKEDSSTPIIPRAAVISRKYSLSEEELEAIMLREFGPIRRKRYSEPKVISTDKKEKPKKKATVSQKNMTIIDGYNLIYSWDSLKAVAEKSFEDARRELIELLENYSAFTKMHVTLVFDAYLVKGGRGSDFERGDYRVVYTKQDQTADSYIEKMMFELGPNYNIRVVTGDRLLQYSAIHSGIMRMTAKEFEAEVVSVGNDIREFAEKLSQQRMNGTPVVTEKKEQS
jgi:predicted RNA-binding protein with PIN domain